MYVNYAEYLHGHTTGRGLRLDIHPYQTLPFVSENGISVTTGHSTYIGLKLVSVLYKNEK